MNTLAEILIFIIESLGTVFLIFVALRFFLQIARADFYNPFSQAIVKVTNPVLIPIRRVIPGLFGIDIASIILALIVQSLIAETIALILYQNLVNPLMILSWALLGTLKLSTYIIIVCIVILVISSFVAPQSRHPAILLAHQLLAPLMSPVQKLIPPVGGLDFSVFFIGMAVYIVQMVLDAFASSLSLHPQLIIGY